MTGIDLFIGDGSSCPSGYSPIATHSPLNGDLNQGAGGKDIYLCHRSVPADASISGLILSESEICPSGYTRTPHASSLNGDLNQGAGPWWKEPKNIKLCQQKGGQKVITSLTLTTGTCPNGFERSPHVRSLNGDLNQEAGGKDIYLCQQTTQVLSLSPAASLPDTPESEMVMNLNFKPSSRTIKFEKNGFPLDYHALFGNRWQHMQFITRLPDANGHQYYLGTYSQNCKNDEGGMVFVGELAPGSNMGKVIWMDELNRNHESGGYNHPGDIRRIGNMVIIAGQDWSGTNISNFATGIGGDAMDLCSTDPRHENVLFYDVSNAASPIYVGQMNSCWDGDVLRTLAPGQDIDSISAGKSGDYYFLSFNGMVCRSKTFNPSDRWEFIDTRGFEADAVRFTSGGKEYDGVASYGGGKINYQEMVYHDYSGRPNVLTSATKNVGRSHVTSGSATAATKPKEDMDGSTFSFSALPNGKSYLILGDVHSDEYMTAVEIEN